MNRRTLLSILIIIAVLLAIKFIFLSKKQKVEGPAAGTPSKPMPVSGLVLKGRDFADKIQVTGSVISNEEVELKPETNGRITGIFFKEGSYVKKGALLVKLNNADLLAQLSKAKSQLKLLQDRENRQRRLLEIKAISQEEFDLANNQVVGVKADLDLLEAQIAKTEIRAPFDGKIGLKYLSEGSFITSGNRIALLQDIHPVKIDFSIPERFREAVKTGDALTFRLEGKDTSFVAKIYAIEPKIDPNTRNLQVRAIYDNKNEDAYPGSFAKIEVVLKNRPNAILIPSETIIPEMKGEKVFIAKGGKVAARKITTGTRTEKEVLVLAGLAPGDTLITSGMFKLKPDAPVKVIIK